MIHNEKQYKITKGNLERFQHSLRQLNAQNDSSLKAQTRILAVESEIEDLQAQLFEYETLRHSGNTNVPLAALESLAQELIKARIAKGLTQAALAKQLGMKSQMIQRYETNNYENASLARVLEVARVLQNTRT
jgi:ribosome-binding protein aMBF1 (putative translation factor)